MTLAFLRDRFAAALEWIVLQIAARSKVALFVWIASLVIAAWVL